MSNTVSGYLANSTSGKIETSVDSDFNFKLGKMAPTGSSTGCVLGFVISTTNASNLKIEARLNSGPVIFSYGPSSTNLTRSFLEVFDGVLSSTTDNNLTFSIVGGTGAAIISNVVVWYHMTV